MALFRYSASNNKGKIVSAVIECDSKGAALERLRGSGWLPIRVEEVDLPRRAKTGLAGRLKMGRLRRGRPSAQDMIVFTRQLKDLLGAGFQLDRSLGVTLDLTANEMLKKALTGVRRDVQSGRSFSAALADHPDIFSPMYVAMVRAGEWGGALEAVIGRLADFLELESEIRRQVRASLAYPTLVVCAGAIAITILVTFVIPRFSSMFGALGQALPLPTLLLIKASGLALKFGWVVAVLGFAVYLGLRRYAKTAEGKYRLDNLKLNLPIFGNLLIKVLVSRFSRTLATMLESGVPVLRALEIVGGTLGNEVFTWALDGTREAVRKGMSMSRYLEGQGVFPYVAVQMMGVGEETGNLEGMLERVAKIYDDDVRTTLRTLLSLLEPAITLLMAGVVGFIVVAMLLPILSANKIGF